MTPLSYNLSVIGGITMAAVGAGSQWGWPIGLLAAGMLVVAMSAVGLYLLAGR